MQGDRAKPSGKAGHGAVGFMSWLVVFGLYLGIRTGGRQDTRRNSPTASPLIPPPRQFGGFFVGDDRRPGAEAQAGDPAAEALRPRSGRLPRQQAGGPSTPAPGTGAGSSSAPAPTGSTIVPDLSLPAEERAIGGGEPTEVTAEEEAAPSRRSRSRRS